ncbi:hypothetical protein [Kamptonema formosum]|uniref:hypothetical protein n=1 Tax=Kamptonema formosum TaxID=331992 RepID=UPI0012DF8EBD|nr:hypothetical protein [Oscillatoria sp. PCC 10802]
MHTAIKAKIPGEFFPLAEKAFQPFCAIQNQGIQNQKFVLYRATVRYQTAPEHQSAPQSSL